MRAKEFFRQVSAAERELKVINARIRHYEEIGLNISAGFGTTGNTQKGTSRVELAAVGAADALSSLGARKREYEDILGRAEALIQAIPQEKYRQILSYRYLCDWSFRSISDELRYNDPNSIYRAHGYALSEAQKILDQEEVNNAADRLMKVGEV